MDLVGTYCKKLSGCNIKPLIAASINEHVNRTMPTNTETWETPSYCFNSSAPTLHDQELEALRLQLIFWVEGNINDENIIFIGLKYLE